MNGKELLRYMMRSYPVIVTGALISTCVFCLVFRTGEDIGLNTLWEIVLLGLICEVSFLIYYSGKTLSKRAMLVRQILHVVALVGVLTGCAVYWQWVRVSSMRQILFFVFLVLCVYAIVLITIYRRDKMMAELMNEGLKKYSGTK